MKTKILADFQICISVPLIKYEFFLTDFLKRNSNTVLLHGCFIVEAQIKPLTRKCYSLFIIAIFRRYVLNYTEYTITRHKLFSAICLHKTAIPIIDTPNPILSFHK